MTDHPLVSMAKEYIQKGVYDHNEIFEKIYARRLGVHYSSIRKAIQVAKNHH